MKPIIKSSIYLLMAPFLKRRAKDANVYLTFDDGPHTENTPVILDTLAKYEIKVTFFMLGKAMEENPDIVKRIIEEGHTVAYHSYRHYSMKKRSFKQVREDVQKLKDISKQFNHSIKLYRPPYGDLSFSGFLWYVLNGIKIIMWSHDSRDSFDELDQVKNNLTLDKVSGGEIVLFHDDYPHVKDLLETVLADYSKNNIRCLPL